jgi:hypothetical protein
VTAYQQVSERIHVIGACSVESPKCPEKNGVVRACCLLGGFVMVEDEDKRGCMVTYIAQADLKGNLPVSVVQYAMKKNPMCVADLRRMAEKAAARK